MTGDRMRRALVAAAAAGGLLLTTAGGCDNSGASRGETPQQGTPPGSAEVEEGEGGQGDEIGGGG
jgi:hypothetical protein